MGFILQEDGENIYHLDKEVLLYQEYEAVYIGKQPSISSVYFKGLDKKQKQLQALNIIRFAIEQYLNWSPYDIKRYLKADVLEKLKLKTLVDRYIEFPPEYSKDGMDMTYLAYLLYPDKFHLNLEEQCITMFEKVHSGEVSRFPSSWIEGITGIRRLSILMQYAISQMPRFKNLEEMYDFFSGPKGTKMAKEFKLYTLYKNVFEAFHHSMPKNLKSDFLYYSRLFQNELKK